ncbi:hypothetical protein ACN20G_08785 [Streptomyces sp. BI20]|uniref:hypothetical protein n=1 Tax=Streptomyces sp. BI20 TaxID=3403460 RepID=UPI003C771AE0
MVCALGAAVCFGTASVFQAMAARAVASPDGGAGGALGLLWRAVRQWRYLLGLGLDGAGFVLQIAALRALPIYVVGAALAASLAVTALVAARLLGTRLSRAEWAAVAVVCAGLALLASASGAEGGERGPGWLPGALLAAAVGVLAVGAVAGRLPAGPRALVLGLAAGTGFGVVEVAVRLIDALEPGMFAHLPVWALLVGGAAGFLLLTSALERGSVTAATAGLVLGETVAPAVVGVWWLGDRTRPGLAPLAVAGFALAVVAALALSRFGEPDAGPGPEAGLRAGRR